MAKKKKPEEHVNLERWMVSYADFMTLLFATFVVLYALAQIDLKEFNTVQSRKVLVLKEDDEIIEFEPATLKDKVIQNTSHVITPITSSDSNKISEEIVKNQQLTADAIQQEIARVDVITDESVATPVNVNVTQSEVTTKVSDVPAVIIPPVEVKLDGEDSKKQQEDVITEVEDEVTVKDEKTLDEIVAPEIATVVNKPQKEKKSWFGWFKRNKKEDISEKTDEVENIVEQEHVDDVSPELADFLDQIPSEDPTEEDLLDKQSKDENIPLIRTQKAEVPEVDEVEVKQEKKKFVWWWQRGKSEQVEQPEQSGQSDQECLPEEKTKSKKIKGDLPLKLGFIQGGLLKL